ncbi:putative PEP-binding protein [Streptomyces sp. NPDC102462]|uniref:putative PEP-binding protein n=1 Tax=Streptomyces sp. NPDC102462 TaxID=3366178 RepID=UPI00381E0875
MATTVDDEGVGRVWDLGKRLLTQLHGRIPRGEAQSLTTVVLDGRLVVVVGGRNGEVVVAEMGTGTQVGSTISGEANGARGVVLGKAYGRDIVVTGGLSAIARVYDLASGTELASVYTGFNGQIHAVAATEADGRPLAVLACADGRIRAWEPFWSYGSYESGKRPAGHSDTVHCVATAETDGRAVVVSASDATARVWDLATGDVVGTPITGHGVTGPAMATAHIEGRLVVITGGFDGMARVWDPATGEETGRPLAHGDAVKAVAVTVLDGRPVLVTGDRDGAVRIWDLADRRLLRGPLPGHEDEVADAATTLLDGRAVAVTGDGTGTVLVWDLATGARVGEVMAVEPNPESDDEEGFLDAVATAVVEDRPVVVTLGNGDTSGMLRMWDLATVAPVGEPLTMHKIGAVSLTTAVLGGRPVAITGGGDGTVRVWDLTTREELGPPTQFTDPDDTVRARITARVRTLRGLAHDHGPGQTRDRHRVELLANIGTPDDAERLDPDGVDGVGLFRTEVLFLGRDNAPARNEQALAYERVLRQLPGRKVVVRTLDAGADKPLAFVPREQEENPALGVRGFRVERTAPHIVDTQLDALAEARNSTEAEPWVMAPMIATPEEAAAFAAMVHRRRIGRAGAMIEVPAAAIRAADILREVDFVSIGTNDLAQYTMAADRLLGGLADLLDAWQPAVLHLVAGVLRATTAAGKPAGVCGESAADPLMALALTGLGATSLSMAPSSIPTVRYTLGRHTLAQCRNIAEAALSAPTAPAAHAAVLQLADPEALNTLGVSPVSKA